jgi:putative nucleotidyltransferase with HDIG domain
MDKVLHNLKGKKFLVVEDDAHLRNVICTILQGQGAEVRFAENGLVAKTILDLNEDQFDLVMSDVRMPELDGIQLLQHVREKHGTLRFLIFTGFSEILEAQQAFNMGANGFLAKPFTLADFMKTVAQILTPPAEVASHSEEATQSYCRVNVNEFLSTSKLPSDIHVKVAEGRYVKVAREGAAIEVSRIQIYKDRKVDFFYVATEDFHKYTGLNLRMARAIKNSNRISAAQKLKLYKHTSEILIQQIFVEGLDPALCENVEMMVENTLATVCENGDLTELLMTLQSDGDRLYSHSLGVAVYSCMIAQKIGWTSAPNQYKLMLAGLFHDIGLKEISPDLHHKPRVKMTREEVQSFETHCTRGRDILLAMDGFPADLAQIVFQHHETQSGTGYPMQIYGSKIHPLARLIRLADEFNERMMDRGDKSLAAASEVMLELLRVRGDDFDAEIMGGALALFGIEKSAAKKQAG